MFLHISDQIQTLPPGAVLRGPRASALSLALAGLVGRNATRRLLDAVGSSGLAALGEPELAAVSGLSRRAARRLAAACELADLLSPSRRTAVEIHSPCDLQRYLPPGLAHFEVEVLIALALTSKNEVKAAVLVSKGGVNFAAMTPRDVFVPLVRLSAASAILVHNHPSGHPAPSDDDVALTNTLGRAGQLLGIPILDHVVVASQGLFSFHDAGLMPTAEELERN